MPISPWYRGDTAPSWSIQIIPDSGAFSVAGLTTANFALLIRNTDILIDANGTGSFGNLTAAVMNGSVVTTPASIQYAPSNADTSTPGNFALFLVVTYPGGAVQTISIGTWQVIIK